MSHSFHFVISPSEKAKDLHAKLSKIHGDVPAEQATHIIVLGGDGTLLHAMHQFRGMGKKFYGINCGTVGFMMNPYDFHDLSTLETATHDVIFKPLKMRVEDTEGTVHEAYAFNEVYLYRTSHQTAHIQITVNGQVEMEQLVADGVLVATPAGSTAYNYSAHGPILPLSSNLLALTPLNPFRPRRWRGALIHHTKPVTFDILNPDLRPVSAVADSIEIRSAQTVHVEEDVSQAVQLLYHNEANLEEKIIDEQFLA